MKANDPVRFSFRRGQATVEYVLALAGIVAVIGVMGFLISASGKSAERAANLVESDYP